MLPAGVGGAGRAMVAGWLDRVALAVVGISIGGLVVLLPRFTPSFDSSDVTRLALFAFEALVWFVLQSSRTIRAGRGVAAVVAGVVVVGQSVAVAADGPSALGRVLVNASHD